jgi:hypothetical protein
VIRWVLNDVGSLDGRLGYGFALLDTSGRFVAEFLYETEDEARKAHTLMSLAIESAIATPTWSLKNEGKAC